MDWDWENDFIDDTTKGYDTTRYEPCFWDSEEESSEHSIDDDGWCNTNCLQTFPFTGTTQVYPNEASTPYDFYKLFYNSNFMDQLVTCTNESITKYRLKNESIINHTTVEELNMFFGLMFVYEGRFLNWPASDTNHSFMSDDRYNILLNFLCFNSNTVCDSLTPRPEDVDEDNESDEIPRLFLQSIISYFNELMKTLVYPSEILVIHESAIFKKNRFNIDQFIRGERFKGNDMLHVLIDKNKIYQKLHMHLGFNECLPWENSFKKIVRDLMKDYFEQGHCLYIDNYYNTVSLAEELLSKKTHMTGLLANNKSGNPSLVRSKIPKQTCEYVFRRGICISRYERTNYLSTKYDGQLAMYNDGRRSMKVPAVLKNIAETLCPILRHQNKSFFSPRYSLKFPWYKKFFMHILQIMVYNAWRLHNLQSAKKIKLHDFHLQISHELLKLES